MNYLTPNTKKHTEILSTVKCFRKDSLCFSKIKCLPAYIIAMKIRSVWFGQFVSAGLDIIYNQFKFC